LRNLRGRCAHEREAPVIGTRGDRRPMNTLRSALRIYLWAVYLVAGLLTAQALVSLIHTPGLLHTHAVTATIFLVLTWLSERMTARISSDLVHSMSTVMLIASILVLPLPFPLLIALAVMLATDLARPLPLYKRLYNISHATVATGCATLAFAQVSAPLPRWAPTQLLNHAPAVALLGLVYVILDVGGVQVALALSQQQPLVLTLRQTTLKTLVPEGGAIGLGLLAAIAWTYHPVALGLAVLPTLTVRKSIQAIAQAEGRAAVLERHSAQLEAVIDAGQQLRLQLPRADLVRPLAEAALAVSGATSVIAYLRDESDRTVLERTLVLPPGAVSDAPAVVPLPTELADQPVIRPDERASLVLVALEGDGQTLGQLHLRGVSDSDPETGSALALLANQAAIALQNAQLHERVLAQVSVDGLTGLLTQRAFHARLDEELARCHRLGQPASLILVDIDGLAAINQAGGLTHGDATLTAVATAIRHAVRVGDIVAREGGDEFAVLLPDALREEAIASANHIQAALRAGAGFPTGVRASLGVASLPLHGTTRAALVRAAHQALAGAKALGTDRIAEPDDGAGLLDGDISHVTAGLLRANLATVKALAAAVDAKDAYTQGHSVRVAQYAVALGRAMSLAAPDLERLELTGALHDVGKIAVPDAILRKTERLTEDEFSAIKEHPAMGERMLASLTYLSKDILPAVRHHHERWDGRGYPDSLAGAALPLDAAILAVADAFDAMTSSRTYRSALSQQEAARRIREGSGTQFAPHVVLAFERALAAGDLDRTQDDLTRARTA